MKYTIIVFLCFVCASLAMAFTMSDLPLEIEVTHIRNNKGAIILRFYQDDASFEQDKPFLEKKYSKTKVSDGRMTIKISLSEGTYGIALIDDENSDGEMEYNLIGFPKEGFGFSNFMHKGMLRPKLSDFEFIHHTGNKKVAIEVKYM